MHAIAVEGAADTVKEFAEQARTAGGESTEPYLSDASDILHFHVGAGEVEDAFQIATVAFKSAAALLAFLKSWRDYHRKEDKARTLHVRDPRTGEELGVVRSESPDEELILVIRTPEK